MLARMSDIDMQRHDPLLTTERKSSKDKGSGRGGGFNEGNSGGG
jgi:hypothetical protein